MLQEEKFIGKEDVSRQLLISCFWCAMLVDAPQDGEL